MVMDVTSLSSPLPINLEVDQSSSSTDDNFWAVLQKLKIFQLKALLRSFKLTVSGAKSDLCQRCFDFATTCSDAHLLRFLEVLLDIHPQLDLVFKYYPSLNSPSIKLRKQLIDAKIVIPHPSETIDQHTRTYNNHLLSCHMPSLPVITPPRQNPRMPHLFIRSTLPPLSEKTSAPMPTFSLADTDIVDVVSTTGAVLPGTSSTFSAPPPSQPHISVSPISHLLPPPCRSAFPPAEWLFHSNLPFYDIYGDVTPSAKLIPRPKGALYGGTVKLSFKLTRITIDRLAQPASPFRIVLYIYALDNINNEGAFQYPTDMAITVLNTRVSDLDLHHARKSKSPLNITPYLHLNAENRVLINYSPNNETEIKYQYYVTCKLTKYINSHEVARGLCQYPMPMDQVPLLTKYSHDDVIVSDWTWISIQCPLTRCLLGTPVRSRRCTHLQCFDAQAYLEMNEKVPKWQCPLCNSAADAQSLAVCPFMMHILGAMGERKGVTGVLVNRRDGQWRFPEASSSSSTVMDASIKQEVGSPLQTVNNAAHLKRNHVEIIDSSSESEEDEQEKKKKGRRNELSPLPEGLVDEQLLLEFTAAVQEQTLLREQQQQESLLTGQLEDSVLGERQP